MARKPRLRNPKGSGGVPFQRSDGRWAAFVTIGYRAGRQLKKWVYGASERDVVQKLRTVQGLASSAVLPDKQNITLAVWLDRFSDARGRDRKASTRDLYKHYVRHWKRELGDTSIIRINPVMVQAALVRLSDSGMGDSYRKQLYDFLNNAMSEAVKLGVIESNPVLNVDRPKIRSTKVHDAWTEEEAALFLGAMAEHPLEPMFYLCLVAGLRIGEALALRWDAVQGKTLVIDYTLNRSKNGETFTTPKWDSNGVIPLHTETLAMLEQHRLKLESRKALALEAGLWQENNLMFPSEVGTPLYYRNVLRVFDSAVVRAGVPRNGGTHNFRRTFTTMALGQLEPKEVQLITRHKTISVLMQAYARVRQSRNKKLGLSLSSMLTPTDTLRDSES